MIAVNKTEDINAYMREWYRLNKKMKLCECGCVLIASGYSGHKTTNKHKLCMETKKSTVVANEIIRLENYLIGLKKIEESKIVITI